MEHFGFLSILPPLVAILLAIKTRQVYVSLVLGIFAGWLFIEEFHPFYALLSTVDAFIDVFQDPGNTRTVIFTLLIGSLITLIQVSGGVNGFITFINGLTEKLEKKSSIGSKKLVQLFAAVTGIMIFVESNISILTVGTLFRPIFDRLQISREKLAYIVDSSSAPSCIIIPFNAWGAYIMSLLVLNGLDQPFKVLFSALPYNFYPIIAIVLLLGTIGLGRELGAMKKAEIRTQGGQLFDQGSLPMIATEITSKPPKAGIKHRSFNLIIPIVIMVVSMPLLLLYTGWKTDFEAYTFGGQLMEALGNGSGSSAVLYAVTISTLAAIIMYWSQKILQFRETVDHVLNGMSGMVSLALLMVLAFAIGSLCKKLGTGLYIAELSKEWLSPGLVPFIIFVVSCFIAFSTGTSWGTFAIMLSIAIPMAKIMDANVHMTIAAAIGGGVFGDHCSPISDTTIISSMASASDHVDHVRTQLPYALIAGLISALFYLIIGLF